MTCTGLLQGICLSLLFVQHLNESRLLPAGVLEYWPYKVSKLCMVCFCLLCSLLNVRAYHLWVQFCKSTLLFCWHYLRVLYDVCIKRWTLVNLLILNIFWDFHKVHLRYLNLKKKTKYFWELFFFRKHTITKKVKIYKYYRNRQRKILFHNLKDEIMCCPIAAALRWRFKLVCIDGVIS